MKHRADQKSRFSDGRTALIFLVALLTLAGGWLAFLAGNLYLRQSEQQAVQAALPPLARSIDQMLSELEARLIVDNTHELSSRNSLESVMQALRIDFPFVMALEVRDQEGQLLYTTVPAARSHERLLAPGHTALYESAVKSGRPGYSAIYREPVRGLESHWVDLFAPSRRGSGRQSLVAKISVNDLMRAARDAMDRETVSGLDLAIKETQLAPQWLGTEWPLERHGLRMTLMGETIRSRTGSTTGVQWLLAALGGVSVLFVCLWMRGLRLRQLTKQRLSLLEQKMQSDARIATLGEMSTAIAHELNQPLGAISNYAYAAEKLASQQENMPPTVLEGLAQIRHEAQRGAEVIKSIRNFIRREETESELINVSQLMQDMQPLLQLQAQSQGSRLSVEVANGLLVNCSKALLQQVLFNLSRNALEAMQDIPKASRYLRIRVRLNQQTWRVVFTVIDSGHGISEEIRKSLFKPFFTTKKDGLGIGLSLCLSIAERQGGAVSWHNNPEGGASFELELPATHLANGVP